MFFCRPVTGLARVDSSHETVLLESKLIMDAVQTIMVPDSDSYDSSDDEQQETIKQAAALTDLPSSSSAANQGRT